MYKKVIVTGHVIEVYEMEKQPVNPHEIIKEKEDLFELHLKDTKLLSLDPEVREQKVKELRQQLKLDIKNRGDRKEERRAQTLRDARNKVRRYALANFDSSDTFITLTYAENFQDVKQADKDFKAFIRKFKRVMKQKDFKYLAVREFQKRGAIHYHILTSWKIDEYLAVNEEYIKQLEVEIARDIWGHGFVDVKPLCRANSKHKKYNGKPVDNVGAYLSKYMSKEYDDARLKGCKAYLNSKGLEQPKVYTEEEAQIIIECYGLETKKETFANNYNSEYLGNINYKEYNMKRIESEQ